MGTEVSWKTEVAGGLRGEVTQKRMLKRDVEVEREETSPCYLLSWECWNWTREAQRKDKQEAESLKSRCQVPQNQGKQQSWPMQDMPCLLVVALPFNLSVCFLLSCWIGVLAGQAHVTLLHCRYCIGVAASFLRIPYPKSKWSIRSSYYTWIVSSAKAKAYTMRPGKKMLRYTFYLHSISMWSLLFPVCLLFFPPKPTNQPY